MTTSIQSPEDAVNAALVRIGHQWRVGSLYDGSVGAKKALDLFGQTRDQLLRDGDWHFAGRTVAMTLLKSAPPGGYIPPNAWNPANNPPQPYTFEYAYPSDCLKVRAVKPPQILVPVFDPQPNVYSEYNDSAYTPPQKVILCYVADAVLNYTGRVTNPVTWEASFCEALIAALARRLAPSLSSLDVAKLEAADEQVERMTADVTQG